MLRHWWGTLPGNPRTAYQVIWAWHPEAPTWRRVVPWVYNTVGNVTRDRLGGGAHVTASEEHLIIHGVAARFEVGPVSGRAVRRSSPARLPRRPVGFYEVKGSYLTPALTTQTGLVSGIVGLATNTWGFGYPYATADRLPDFF